MNWDMFKIIKHMQLNKGVLYSFFRIIWEYVCYSFKVLLPKKRQEKAMLRVLYYHFNGFLDLFTRISAKLKPYLQVKLISS